MNAITSWPRCFAASPASDQTIRVADRRNRHQHLRVIPKGLRPFDLRDADHFLQLLPGPYDRDGLPDIVRFWQARIHCDDPTAAIPVGLIYGPSGCGKTSLVRAGIIPRLGKQCTTICVQATPDETEWELACRGGVNRNRWFGFDPRRLHDHAWTATNSAYRTRPVARLLPNDIGLFDVLGNVMEWCQTPHHDYPLYPDQPGEDPGNGRVVIDRRTPMMGRGGAMLYQPSDAPASQRHIHGADSRWVSMGFRVVRTIRSQ